MRFALAVIVMILPGCGRNPDLHSVKGTVTRGGKPVTEGTLQFISTSDSTRAVGVINPDGSFTLITLGPDGKRSGAAAGSYKVLLAMNPREPSVQHDEIFEVKPGENVFTIAIP